MTSVLTLYVLALADEKYYIGITKNLHNRFQQHLDGNGAKWTTLYKPINIIESFQTTDKADEDKYTLKYMKKYGIDNVRGGTFASPVLDDSLIVYIKLSFKTIIDICFYCNSDHHFASECPGVQWQINDYDLCKKYLSMFYDLDKLQFDVLWYLYLNEKSRGTFSLICGQLYLNDGPQKKPVELSTVFIKTIERIKHSEDPLALLQQNRQAYDKFVREIIRKVYQ